MTTIDQTTVLTRDQAIAARFAHDTAHHEMTILHDDGLYRHVRFARPGRSMYWFELVTWPGALSFTGDMGAFTFRRLDDMFAFFGGNGLRAEYWSEKILDGRERTTSYDEDVFEQLVTKHLAEIDPELAKAVRLDLLEEGIPPDEDAARKWLEYWEIDGAFHDTREWSLHSHSVFYLWACHAIQWGIGQYHRQMNQVAARRAPSAPRIWCGEWMVRGIAAVKSLRRN